MRVVRACLRTMTTVIFIRLRVARRFIFHFFWYRLRFSEFFQVRILPEKLLVLLNRVHARVLFIQQFLQWARLLRIFETEEAQMWPVNNGGATGVRIQVRVRLQLLNNSFASVTFNFCLQCCLDLFLVDSSHLAFLLLCVLPHEYLFNHFFWFLLRRMISENLVLGLCVLWFDALYFITVLWEIMSVWEHLICAVLLVLLELLKFKTLWRVDVVIASSALLLKSRRRERRYLCVFVVLAVKILIGFHNN